MTFFFFWFQFGLAFLSALDLVTQYKEALCHVTGYPTPVVTWRKLSSHLPLWRVRYNNSALQISQVRKEDSDLYTCSAKNLLGKDEKNTLLVVVSLPRFTSKPPSKIMSIISCIERLNCSATGDPQPIISWRKQGGQLPIGRSQQISGALIITNLQQSDAGNYICTATSAGVFDVEAVATLEIQKGGKVILENYCVIIRSRSEFETNVMLLFSKFL